MNEIRCDECGSIEYTKSGFRTRNNPNPPPKRIQVRQYKCKKCFKIFIVKDNAEGC